MQVDIYVKETTGSRELRIPWLPDKVRCDSNGTRMASYDIMDVGEVQVPSGSNLSRFYWSSYFPGEGHKELPFLRGTWQEPKNIQNLLNEWKEKGTPLRILMTGTPINHDVYLEDCSIEYESGYGDYKYDISFRKRREIKIIATKVAVPQNNNKAPSTSSPGKTYTVKGGDTLWAIARKYLGNAKKHGMIYELNKTIIEETAKKRGRKSSNGGHWIYPGTILQLPY